MTTYPPTWPDGTIYSTNNDFTAMPPRGNTIAEPQEPKKHGPRRTKTEQSVIALETTQERALRIAIQIQEKRVK